MYRPEGFKAPYVVPTPSLEALVLAEQTDAVRFLINEAYEAGADAYGEALKKGGVKFTRKLLTIDDRLQWMPAGKVGQKGWLVFIPEE